MEQNKSTMVIGCLFSVHDLQFVRFENCALVSIAFDVPGCVIFYTKTVTEKILEDDEIDREKNILKRVLSGFWNESVFGIHELSGGNFETILPSPRHPFLDGLDTDDFILDDQENTDKWFETYS